MLISYICAVHTQGYENFTSGVPSVPHLQVLIEDAWEKGINADGRIETGGIMGTRKYIGTPEVCLSPSMHSGDYIEMQRLRRIVWSRDVTAPSLP